MLEKEIQDQNDSATEIDDTPAPEPVKKDGRKKPQRSPAQIAATQRLVERRREMIEQKKAASTAKSEPKKPKKKPAQIVQSDSSESESEEEVVVKRKKKSKPKRRVVYETETDSEDEYVNHVRSRAAAYYKLMF